MSSWVSSCRTRAAAGAEALLHPFEGLEEGHRVVHDVGPGHAGDGAEQGLGRHSHELEADPGRPHQRLEHPVLQEAGEPAGGVEKIKGVACRGCVHHHQVEPAFLHQLVELLHGHVLLGARERAGEIAVDAVDLDVLRLLGRVRIALDQVVKGALGVEHQRVEPAGPGAVDRRGFVGQRADTQRIGQPAGRVDGDHAGGAAQPGRLQRQDRGRGRLPDAAGTAADDDGPLEDQLLDARRVAVRRHAARGPGAVTRGRRRGRATPPRPGPGRRSTSRARLGRSSR